MTCGLNFAAPLTSYGYGLGHHGFGGYGLGHHGFGGYGLGLGLNSFSHIGSTGLGLGSCGSGLW